MINISNIGYLYMNYYLHISPPLMHFYTKCITYDLSVIVEWRTARCGPTTYIHDSYHKTTTSTIENDVSPLR